MRETKRERERERDDLFLQYESCRNIMESN